MSDEDAYTPDGTPACPFCDSEDTIQVRPDIARCSEADCSCERFWLDDPDSRSDKIEVPDFEFEVGEYVSHNDVSKARVIGIFYSYDCIVKEQNWYYRVDSRKHGEFVISPEEAHKLWNDEPSEAGDDDDRR